MKLISWNVNGLRAVVKKGFGDFLKDYRPDVLALQEIKVSDQARLKEKFDFVGYQEYWHPAQRLGYSGTGILTKIKPLSVVNGFGHSRFDDEGRSQTLEFADFYLINVYFPNAQPGLARLDYKLQFNQELLKYLKKLDKLKPIVVCGDFNVALQAIDLKNPEANKQNPGFSVEERQSAQKYITAGLVDSFRYLHPDKVQYSWWSYRFFARQRNIGWRIDYFFVSARLSQKIKRAYILDQVLGSDHAPVGLTL